MGDTDKALHFALDIWADDLDAVHKAIGNFQSELTRAQIVSINSAHVSDSWVWRVIVESRESVLR